MKSLVVIVGPTGVGKTDLCLHIAKHYDISIINADSRQIFAELPIGTAAPTVEQQKVTKHNLVGTHHIEEYYSASMFEQEVLGILSEQYGKGQNIALMSGGSMMYIDAVCNGIDDIPTIDSVTRETLACRFKEEGLPSLLKELETLDPEHYAIVDKNNYRRVIHALEVCHMTGKTYTSFRKRCIKQRPFNIVKIGLTMKREKLYDRINQRVLQMIGNGLVDEVRGLYPLRALNSLNTVGYKELFEYFDGNCTLGEAILNIQSNTRKYCRKQLTWFKRDDKINWFTPDNVEEIINYIDTMV